MSINFLMNTVIFTDIDGVLLTFPDAETNSYSHSKAFTKSCVDVLNKITDSTGAKLVVSSAWRIERSIEYLQKLFKDNGVTGDVIGKTDDPEDDGSLITISKTRGEYIQKWVDENKVDRYAIIDDSEWDLNQSHPDNFYHIKDGDKGLQESDIEPYFETMVNGIMNNLPVIKGEMAYASKCNTTNRRYGVNDVEIGKPTYSGGKFGNGFNCSKT